METKQLNKVMGTVSVLISLLVSCEKIDPYHEDGSEITLAEAVEIVRPIIDSYADDHLFFVGKDPIEAQTTLKYGPLGNYDPDSKYCGTFKSPKFKSWLIVIGPNININGVEKQLHLFVDVMTGKYQEVFLEGQVSDIEWDESYMKVAEDPSVLYQKTSMMRTKAYLQGSTTSTSGMYAVIISGGVSNQLNYARYWEDCCYIYNRLIHDLGYNKNHVICLVSDGTDPGLDMVTQNGLISSPLDFDNDGYNDVLYSATKSQISSAFNALQYQLSSIDHLLVFVTDHGSPAGKICLWGNNQEMTPAELNAELNKLPGVKMDIVLGQCYSGAFITPLTANNRTITTACSATEVSYGNGYLYDYFLHGWTDAFSPTNASSVDTNSDNMISLREAFVYASANDPKAVSGDEHPQYNSSPLIYGYTHDLLGADNCPMISGSDYLSCSFATSYMISGLPSSTSVTWNSYGDINLSSPTNTSVSAQGALPSSSYVSSDAKIIAYFTLQGTQYHIIKDIRSIWKSGYYYGLNQISGGSGHYSVETGDGASGYQWGSDNSAWVILSQGSPEVSVSEGSTSSPVTLWVTFQDPWGSSIVVGQQFN